MKSACNKVLSILLSMVLVLLCFYNCVPSLATSNEFETASTLSLGEEREVIYEPNDKQWFKVVIPEDDNHEAIKMQIKTEANFQGSISMDIYSSANEELMSAAIKNIGSKKTSGSCVASLCPKTFDISWNKGAAYYLKVRKSSLSNQTASGTYKMIIKGYRHYSRGGEDSNEEGNTTPGEQDYGSDVVTDGIYFMDYDGTTPYIFVDNNGKASQPSHDKLNLFLTKNGDDAEEELSLYCYNIQSEEPLKVVSSDPSILYLKSQAFQEEKTEDHTRSIINIYPQKLGVCTLTISKGGYKRVLPVVIKRPVNEITAMQTDPEKYHLFWESIPDVAGYYVYYVESESDTDPYSGKLNTIRVEGEKNTEIDFTGKKGKYYTFLISPWIIFEGKEQAIPLYTGELSWQRREAALYYLDPLSGSQIDSVNAGDDGQVTIHWKHFSDIEKYILYRSESENNCYKKNAEIPITAGNGEEMSYTDSVLPGKTYYYRLVPIIGGVEGVPSYSWGTITRNNGKNSISRIGLTKEMKKKWKKAIINYGVGDTSSYVENGRLHILFHLKKKLYILGLDEKYKQVSKKVINVSMPEEVYHAPDGKNYLVYGYNNPKESSKKTVIKIAQYSSDWKPLKTAKISGGVSNLYKGIYEPFRAGRISFDVLGNKLYLFTARTMFLSSDGLHHQTNIAFEIDTDTMQAKEKNISYVSHSFDQRVRFKDGGIYLADLGDAYPRGININVVGNYTEHIIKNEVANVTFSQKKENGSIINKSDNYSFEVTPFLFKGHIGDNNVGADITGMEIGKDNMLIMGTANPHYFKIQGSSGFSSKLNDNIYVVITNRRSGKSEVKWLTSFDPKGKKHSFLQTWFLKLSDKLFAVMYADKKKKKETLHYMLIDDGGEVVYKKDYSNLKGISNCVEQPFLLNGYIQWYFSGDDGEWYSGRKVVPKVYRIPVMW